MLLQASSLCGVKPFIDFQIMNEKAFGSQPWPVLRYCPCIFPDGLRKTWRIHS
jgi:hypothetical protein